MDCRAELGLCDPYDWQAELCSGVRAQPRPALWIQCRVPVDNEQVERRSERQNGAYAR